MDASAIEGGGFMTLFDETGICFFEAIDERFGFADDEISVFEQVID